MGWGTHFISLYRSPFYLTSGHRCTITVNIFFWSPISHLTHLPLPPSPSIPNPEFAPSLGPSPFTCLRPKQLQLRPFWPTSTQYPFQSALHPLFYFLSHRHWSLFADAVKLWGGNTHGEVSVPLCLNAWEVTYLGAEREGKMAGFNINSVSVY